MSHRCRKCHKCGRKKVSIEVEQDNPVFCDEACLASFYEQKMNLDELTTFNLQVEVIKNTKPLNLLYTDPTLQFGIENVPIKGNIIKEIHRTQTQCVMVLQGKATVTIYDPTKEGTEYVYPLGGFEGKDTLFIPANTYHQVDNVSDEILKFITFYAPPVHKEM